MKPDEATTVYDGEYISVTRERWGARVREIVHRADVVAIVAVDVDGFVTLVRQLREAARRPVLEIPAGTIEGGEEPLETARRELLEETGLHGGRWRAGPGWWTTPGFCRERAHLFFAEDLERGQASPDEERKSRSSAGPWPSCPRGSASWTMRRPSSASCSTSRSSAGQRSPTAPDPP